MRLCIMQDKIMLVQTSVSYTDNHLLSIDYFDVYCNVSG